MHTFRLARDLYEMAFSVRELMAPAISQIGQIN